MTEGTFGAKSGAWVFLTLVATFAAPALVSADTWNEPEFRVEGTVAFLSGAVAESHLTALKATSTLSHVVLNSAGGEAVAAIEIAREVHRRGLTTYVGPDSQCVSACTIIFQAGSVRIVHPRTFFGYHFPRRNNDSQSAVESDLRGESVRAQFRALYSELGLPEWAINEFWHPDVMVYYSADELLRRNVATIITDMGLANR